MKLYVVRHAHAGSRSTWAGADHERPLSKKGRRQAAGIADRLAGAGVARLVSSPAVRCVQTLEPLAARLGLPVDADERLLEGASGGDALGLAGELCADGGEAAVLCSHGDVIPELLRALKHASAIRIDEPVVWPKGSTWTVTWDGQGWTTASYAPPPG